MNFVNVFGEKMKTPSLFNWRPATYGVLIENKKILLIKPAWNKDKYSLPGGGIKLGEEPQDAIIREFLEETGLSVFPKKVLGVDSSFYSNPENNHNFQRLNIFFEVELKKENGLNKNTQILSLDAETTSLVWVDIEVLKPEDFTFFQRKFIKEILGE